MQVTKINNSYSATGQINVSDLDEIFADGFKTIVCFRPEQEDAEHQPKQKTLQEAAAQRGMTFLSIPIIPGNITPDHVSQFSDLMHTGEQPILGYCKKRRKSEKYLPSI